MLKSTTFEGSQTDETTIISNGVIIDWKLQAVYISG